MTTHSPIRLGITGLFWVAFTTHYHSGIRRLRSAALARLAPSGGSVTFGASRSHPHLLAPGPSLRASSPLSSWSCYRSLPSLHRALLDNPGCSIHIRIANKLTPAESLFFFLPESLLPFKETPVQGPGNRTRRSRGRG